MNQGRRPAHEEMKLLPGFISTRQLSEATEIDQDLIDMWTRAGLIQPAQHIGEGKGSRRVWLVEQAEEILQLRERITACPYEHRVE